MGRAWDISYIMETFDGGLLELRVAQCFTDAVSEVLQGSSSLFLVSEAVYVDEWELESLWVGGVFAPNLRVGILEQAYESVKELNCIHRQVHVAMVETQGFEWDLEIFSRCCIFTTYNIALGNMKLHELPCIHIEGNHSILDFIKLNVLFAVGYTLRIQIIANYSQLPSFDCTLDRQRTYSTEHITQYLAVSKISLNHSIAFSCQLWTPIDFTDINFEPNFILNLNSLVSVLLTCNAFQIIKSKLGLDLS